MKTFKIIAGGIIEVAKFFLIMTLIFWTMIFVVVQIDKMMTNASINHCKVKTE